ncbi:MAG TPA: hypothetical protein PKY10_02000, partial [Lentisphaeria bacterium]|nr:hypothetical protein [Lentisphaeria bacterium]
MPSSMFRRALSVLALLFALSAGADVRLWPFFYAKTDPVAHHNQLEVFWPLYSRDADEQRTVHRILSFQREFPSHYPWQVYFLWPITALRLGNGHDAWLFPFLWSGSDGDKRNHNSVFPFWIYYRNDDYRTLNLAILNHNSWSKQHHSHYLFPLWWAKWSHYGNAKSSSHGLFPLYSLYRKDKNDSKRPEYVVRQRRGNATLAYWSRYAFQNKMQRRDRASFGVFPIAHSSWSNSLRWDKKTADDLLTDRQTSLYLFPYWQSTRLRQQLPLPPAPGQDYTEMIGKVRRQKHSRHLFPLFYDMGRTTYTADSALAGARRTTWIFPYWHTYRVHINPIVNSQAEPHKDVSISEPSAREKRISHHTVPLLFNRRSTTWVTPDDATTLVAADNSLYLFPYYRSTYLSANAESANSFFLLGGWGRSTQTKPAANKHYAYLLPFLFYKHQAKPAPPENPAEDWTDTKLWILPYWCQRGHTGNQENRTDFLVPLYLRSYEAHAKDRTWWTVLAGVGETQAPAYLKRKSDPNDEDCINWHCDNHSTRFFFPLWHQSNTSATRSWNIFPLLWRRHTIDDQSTKTTSNTYPLLLSSSHQTVTEKGQETTGHTYLLGLGGWRRSRENGSDGLQTTSLRHHLFPLWHHRQSSYETKTSMLLPPFSYRVVNHAPESCLAQTRSLAIPHAWLPIYKSQHTTNNDNTTNNNKSWLFPFYVHETYRADDFARFSILWWLYQRERSHSETRAWGLGGGLANYYEKDANGFVERSILYRLYHREERSWFEELEVMPFYYRSRQEDNSGGWSVFGGMFGSRQDGRVKTTRVFFIPFRTTVASTQPFDAAASAKRHLEYALNYLEARRFDRAAIEFIFAEGSYETNAVIVEQAGDAFAQADADHFQEFFRRDLPSSLSKVSNRAQRYRQDASGRQLRQRAIELYRQAIANGGNQDDLELKIAVCLAPSDLGGAKAILEERFERSGDFHHGLDCLRLRRWRHDELSPPEVIAELRRRYPEYALVHYLQAMHDLNQKQVNDIRTRDYIWQWRWRNVTPEEHEKLIAALNEVTVLLKQTIALSPVDYPPARLVQLPQPLLPLLRAEYDVYPATSDGLPTSAVVRGLAATEMLEIMLQQYWVILDKKQQTPEDDAEKRRLLTEMMTYLPLLQDVRGGIIHDVCRLHRDYYRNPEHLLNELLKVQEQIPAPTPGIPSALAKDCADEITRLRRQLSYLTRWDVQLVSGQPSLLGIGPFVTKDCGNGYVDLDFFFGCVDSCTAEATTVVVTEKAQEAVLHLGFDRELTVELNGRIVFGPKRDHIARRDEHQVTIQLLAGSNHFKLLTKDDKLSFGFYARLTSPEGEPLFFP